MSESLPRRSDADLVAQLDFPPEWHTADWMLTEVLLVSKLRGGQEVFIAGGVLKDGSNLIGLTHPRGQRVARSSPVTGWSIEERFSGDQEAVERDLGTVWSTVIRSVTEAKVAVDAMGLGGEGVAP
jgi:hypothetical protein